MKEWHGTEKWIMEKGLEQRNGEIEIWKNGVE
jgi:hypothetical protein